MGAALVDLGPIGTVFVWLVVDGRTVTWERKVVLGRGLSLGAVPSDGGSYALGSDRLVLDGLGGLRVDVGMAGGDRLRAELTAGDVTPAVLVTDTPGGGWNVTEKRAGYPVLGWVEHRGDRRPVEGGGWRDWTAGRQDRHTSWRWAAGAGTAVDGRRVGFNLSTGMNAGDEGEDVVWWDGTPHGLEVRELGPSGPDPAGAWAASGPGWEIELETWGVRAADEGLWLLRSSYVQPIGRFRGTLPGPDGAPIAIAYAVGVTEHHDAMW